jgi:hypothetical protein
MTAIAQATPASSSFDIVIGCLLVPDENMQRDATSILCRLGTNVVPLLVEEACRPRMLAKHVIILLNLAQQIGIPLLPSVLFGLQSLLDHRAACVRKMAEQMIMSTSPGGVPDSPEGLAVMRAFNPFLQPPRRRRRPGVTTAEIRDFCHRAFGSPQRSGCR